MKKSSSAVRIPTRWLSGTGTKLSSLINNINDDSIPVSITVLMVKAANVAAHSQRQTPFSPIPCKHKYATAAETIPDRPAKKFNSGLIMKIVMLMSNADEIQSAAKK